MDRINGWLISRLAKQFSAHRWRQFGFVICFTLVGAVAELVSIGAVLPFLQLIAVPETVAKFPFVTELMRKLHIARATDLLYPAAIVLIVTAIASALIRMALVWVSTRFIFGLTHDLSTKMFDRVIRQPYSLYLSRNSSEVLSGLEKVNFVSTYFLNPILTAMSSALIAIGIVIMLLLINPVVAIVAGLSIVLLYVLIGLSTRGILVRLGREQAFYGTRRIKLAQEAIGGVRDIILDRSHDVFGWQYRVADARMRRVSSIINSISTAPRYAVEGAGIVLIALFALYYAGQPGGVIAAIPVLGALALGAQRLLPLAQAINVAYAQYGASIGTVEDLLQLLDAPILPPRDRNADTTIVPMREGIVLDRVSFGYDGARLALDDISITIPRGARIGVVGRTGSGKTTLLDVVAGLLTPTSGAVRIDGELLDEASIQNWQAQIAHVPQAIFLLDDTIAANIAFGLPHDKIDIARVRDAARRADIDSFVETLPEGFDTRVGERGARLSGGQRQRIGIARALYKRATVLILDEATSALDTATEIMVMAGIEQLDRNLTILMIAHRLTTVANCDQIIRLEGGRIVAQGSFVDVVGSTGAPMAEGHG